MRSSERGALMSIGQAAGHFGLAPHVLRHWESVGLLSPRRAEGDRRRYGRDDLYRIAVILRAKEAGLGLDDIREVFLEQDLSARRAVLQRHRTGLLRRIAEARASLELIEGALGCDHEDFTGCANFQALVARRMAFDEPVLPAPRPDAVRAASGRGAGTAGQAAQAPSAAASRA